MLWIYIRMPWRYDSYRYPQHMRNIQNYHFHHFNTTPDTPFYYMLGENLGLLLYEGLLVMKENMIKRVLKHVVRRVVPLYVGTGESI